MVNTVVKGSEQTQKHWGGHRKGRSPGITIEGKTTERERSARSNRHRTGKKRVCDDETALWHKRGPRTKRKSHVEETNRCSGEEGCGPWFP